MLRIVSRSRMLLASLVMLSTATVADAHFIWLLPEPSETGAPQVQVYFGEDASPDDPALLDRLAGLKVWQLSAKGEPVELVTARDGDSLVATPQGDKASSALFVAAHDLGVLDRGDAKFRLQYYAKSGPALGHDAWSAISAAKQLKLDVVPSIEDGQLQIVVRFNGEPVEGAQVVLASPKSAAEAATDANGQVRFPFDAAGVYSIRARYVEAMAGELDGEAYPETRHYSTIGLNVPATPTSFQHLAPLAQAVTSFGGIVDNGRLYIYGGHTGEAHSYAMKDQGHELLSLSLDGSGEWKSLAEGPPLQGLALVAHQGKLYRLGGFTAKNAEGEKHDLWSQADAAMFDLQSNTWTDLPPLPEPRSSFDAAVLGNSIYVVGGWSMQGEVDSVWHTTAWKLDLSTADPKWEAIPSPPFQRRALSVAAFGGKLYAIGGMQSEGGPTKQVAIFDPAAGDWTEGPELLGESQLTGFGSSAFAAGDRLYVSTINGDLLRLSEDGQSWEHAGLLPTARFFHRMLPVDAAHLVIVGGANMGTGKFVDVELIGVP
ncbi:MAG: DUF4198 domain-containing protein [Planctomycetaceae bacterium]